MFELMYGMRLKAVETHALRTLISVAIVVMSPDGSQTAFAVCQ
jgi:hypothetical protein